MFRACVSRAYLLVCKCNDVAPALLDIAVLQNGVQHWVKLLLNVLNQHGLAKGQAVLHPKVDFIAQWLSRAPQGEGHTGLSKQQYSASEIGAQSRQAE